MFLVASPTAIMDQISVSKLDKYECVNWINMNVRVSIYYMVRPLLEIKLILPFAFFVASWKQELQGYYYTHCQ